MNFNTAVAFESEPRYNIRDNIPIATAWAGNMPIFSVRIRRITQ